MFALLSEADWETIGRNLVAFAIYRARNYHWRKGGGEELALGVTVEDIVATVIEKTFSGQRRWDPALGQLEPWLKDQVKSEIDNLYTCAAQRCELAIEPDPDDDGETAQGVVEKRSSVAGASAEDGVLQQEETRLTQQLVQQLFESVNGDPSLEAILSAIIDGCEPKPRFLAEKLGISIQETNNRLKRLRRQVLKLRKGELLR